MPDAADAAACAFRAAAPIMHALPMRATSDYFAMRAFACFSPPLMLRLAAYADAISLPLIRRCGAYADTRYFLRHYAIYARHFRCGAMRHYAAITPPLMPPFRFRLFHYATYMRAFASATPLRRHAERFSTLRHYDASASHYTFHY